MNYDPIYEDINIGLGCAIPMLLIAIIIACVLCSSVWFLVH